MKLNPHIVKQELQKRFPTVEEFFLYGSLSKASTWDLEFLGHSVPPTFDNNTDYDFAVRYTQETEAVFVSSGWTQKDQLDYQDCCTERVFEGIILGERVQVSLRSKFSSFKAAWSSIPNSIYWTILNKRSPQYIGPDLVREYINSLVWLHEGIYGKFDWGKFL